ncbi:hypothetical protein IQ235_13340 [Oscillatoriales cyanobacterium LEGE 11467]|uniref:Uncharacterized protein n=1 Tax=Zarconia navalis LEGE 11467 TaxID=1828826 RepID=A0A928VWT8_9CYAN|nr:hypothetical protein [Zarconia navalis LEGE 11467]
MSPLSPLPPLPPPLLSELRASALPNSPQKGTAIAIAPRGKNRTRLHPPLGYSRTNISVNSEDIRKKTLN